MDDVVRDAEGYRVPFDLGLDVVRRRQIPRPMSANCMWLRVEVNATGSVSCMLNRGWRAQTGLSDSQRKPLLLRTDLEFIRTDVCGRALGTCDALDVDGDFLLSDARVDGRTAGLQVSVGRADKLWVGVA